MQHEIRAHRAPVTLDETHQIAPGIEGGQLSQHQRMGKPEPMGEGAAVAGNAEAGGRQQAGLYRRKAQVLRLKACSERQKPLGVTRLPAHAASRLRNVTRMELEVGVSLSSPALASGTSTFSSG